MIGRTKKTVGRVPHLIGLLLIVGEYLIGKSSGGAAQFNNKLGPYQLNNLPP